MCIASISYTFYFSEFTVKIKTNLKPSFCSFKTLRQHMKCLEVNLRQYLYCLQNLGIMYILPIAFHHFMKCLTFLGISWNALLHRLPVTHTHTYIYIYIHTHTLHVLYSWDSTHHFSVHTAIWCSNHCAPIQGLKGLNNVLYHVFLFPKWLQCHMSLKTNKKYKAKTKKTICWIHWKQAKHLSGQIKLKGLSWTGQN